MAIATPAEIAAAVWTAGTRTLAEGAPTTPTTPQGRIAAAIWANATRTLASLTPELEEPGAGATVIAGIVPTAAQYLFQHATPIADVEDGGWKTYYVTGLPGNNVAMYEDINDGSAPVDTNMIRSGLTPANDTMVTQLSPIVTPEAGTVTIKVRARYC